MFLQRLIHVALAVSLTPTLCVKLPKNCAIADRRAAELTTPLSSRSVVTRQLRNFDLHNSMSLALERTGYKPVKLAGMEGRRRCWPVQAS